MAKKLLGCVLAVSLILLLGLAGAAMKADAADRPQKVPPPDVCKKEAEAQNIPAEELGRFIPQCCNRKAHEAGMGPDNRGWGRFIGACIGAGLAEVCKKDAKIKRELEVGQLGSMSSCCFSKVSEVGMNPDSPEWGWFLLECIGTDICKKDAAAQKAPAEILIRFMPECCERKADMAGLEQRSPFLRSWFVGACIGADICKKDAEAHKMPAEDLGGFMPGCCSNMANGAGMDSDKHGRGRFLVECMGIDICKKVAEAHKVPAGDLPKFMPDCCGHMAREAGMNPDSPGKDRFLIECMGTGWTDVCKNEAAARKDAAKKKAATPEVQEEMEKTREGLAEDGRVSPQDLRGSISECCGRKAGEAWGGDTDSPGKDRFLIECMGGTDICKKGAEKNGVKAEKLGEFMPGCCRRIAEAAWGGGGKRRTDGDTESSGKDRFLVECMGTGWTDRCKKEAEARKVPAGDLPKFMPDCCRHMAMGAGMDPNSPSGGGFVGACIGIDICKKKPGCCEEKAKEAGISERPGLEAFMKGCVGEATVDRAGARP